MLKKCHVFLLFFYDFFVCSPDWKLTISAKFLFIFLRAPLHAIVYINPSGRQMCALGSVHILPTPDGLCLSRRNGYHSSHISIAVPCAQRQWYTEGSLLLALQCWAATRDRSLNPEFGLWHITTNTCQTITSTNTLRNISCWLYRIDQQTVTSNQRWCCSILLTWL